MQHGRPLSQSEPHRRGTTLASRHSLFPVLLLVGATACVPSLHPLYTDEDHFVDERMLGSWLDEDDATWTFEREEDGGLALTFVSTRSNRRFFDSEATGPGAPARFEVHPVLLDGTLFLDLFPESPQLDNDLLSAHLIPVHTFWTAVVEEDALTLRYFDPEWLDKQIESGTVSIQHETIEDVVLLTAPTAELRTWMRRLADEPGAFSDPMELHRQATTP